MKDMRYVLDHFFTHKDFLVPGSQIPGTIFTPLHYAFAAALIAVIVSSAIYVSRRKHLLKPMLASVWAVMVIWEFVIVYWDSVAGKTVGLDLRTNLSLYPCSIYLYAMPFVLWGKGSWKQACCGYICTLGLLGSVVNFLFPITRLYDYSCISFAGMHTFLFHGSMFFTFLVLILSGYHRYDQVTTWQELLLPSVPTLILSVPANIVNYTIDADYMFFRGKIFVLAKLFGHTRPILITLTLYLLYILVPALFYLPSYLHNRREETEDGMLLIAAD